MSGDWRADRANQFYRRAAWAALGVAICGFFLTYILPLSQGRFAGPRWAHLHGAAMASWLILVVVQTQLAHGSLRRHRQLGWLSLVIAAAVITSTVAIARAAAQRDFLAGGSTAAISGLLGGVTAPLIFVGLVFAAVAKRRDPQWHKRLIFIATVAILWPAWFRWRHFLPSVPRPDIWLGLVLADTPLVAAMVRDKLKFGRVHPAYLWCGVPLIAEQSAEALLFDSPVWRAAAQWFYAALA